MTTLNKNKDFLKKNQLQINKIGLKAQRSINTIAYFLALVLFTNCLSVVKAAEDDHDHEHEDEHEDEHDEHEDEGRDFSKGAAWGYGILFTFLLGVVGLLCSIIVVVLKQKTNINFKPIINALVAFAAGSLIGDAIIHLIPAGFGLHTHGDEEVEEINQNVMTLMICLGFVAFFVIEKVLEGYHIGHSHGISEETDKVIPFEQLKQEKQGQQQDTEVRNIENKENEAEIQKGIELSNKQPKEVNPTEEEDMNKVVAVTSVNNELQAPQLNEKEYSNNKMVNASASNLERQSTSTSDDNKNWKNKKTEGYINLLGDFFHNILDGIAIGAIFSAGDWSNCASTLIAILAHEIPQEIGDVGILLHSKFTNFQVLLCNGIVNFSAIIGAIIGLALGEISNKSDRFMTLFVAGSFLYLGATDMLPQVKNEKSKLQGVLQFLFFLLGFGVMFLVLLFESDDHDEHAHEEEEEAGHEDEHDH